MKHSKSSRRWLQEHFHDPFVKKAQEMGFRSRAVFKLMEVQEKDKIVHSGMVVVDLGAAPGGWSQLLAKWVGKKGKVFALDILPMDELPGVDFIQGDFQEQAVLEQLLQVLDGKPVDLVISDMAPNISGVQVSDQAKAMVLAELALECAIKILKPEGAFLVKVFQGEGFEAYIKALRDNFKQVITRKPQASRPRSKEVYLLAKGFKQ